MLCPHPHDDTTSDYEQFEKELLVQDPDATSLDTARVADTTAQRLINELIDANIVTPVPEGHVLVQEPSVTTFDSTTQLVIFHHGWTAGRDADAEGE